MQQVINKISSRMTAIFSMIFNMVRKQADHKSLTRHVIALNKKQSAEQIINETAACLKNILNYRLFAFVTSKEDGVDIWLDPRMYKKSLEKIILEDFSLNNREDLNYLNHTFHPDELEEKFNIDNLVFYEFKEENCYSKIYMLPHRRLFFNEDLVNLVLQDINFILGYKISSGNSILTIFTTNNDDSKFGTKLTVHSIRQYFYMMVEVLKAFHQDIINLLANFGDFIVIVHAGLNHL